jgi:hypothetical protein
MGRSRAGVIRRDLKPQNILAAVFEVQQLITCLQFHRFHVSRARRTGVEWCRFGED